MIRSTKFCVLFAAAMMLCVAQFTFASPTTLPSTASVASASSDAGSPGASDENSFASMDLEQLMQIDVNTGTLTDTQRNLVPAAVTHMDRQDIDNANPRTLMELFDEYVPDEHWEYAMWEPQHLGFRGIISDREADDLMLVDGQEMNERTHEGAFTERDLVLTGDLDTVDVIRGPGSATYGPGAISAVLDLQTYNGLTFQGTQFDVKGGTPWNFGAIEFKHGEKLSPDSGWFIYAGLAQVGGADRAYSPVIQGQDFQGHYGPVTAGEPVPFPFTPEDSSYKNNPQVKFHAELDSGEMTLWARYTMGGENMTTEERAFYAPPPYGWSNGYPAAGDDYGYQQLTLFSGIKHKINDQLSLDASASFSVTDFEEDNPWFDSSGNNFTQVEDSYTEDKLYAKTMLHWTPNKSQQVAFGVEEGHFWLGEPSWFTGESLNSTWGTLPGTLNAPDDQNAVTMPRWQTDLYSFVAEDQWHMNNQWTLFLSGRADRHTYTHWMYSPRAALVYAPDSINTFKLMASQSVRTNFEEQMKYNYDTTGKHSQPESMKSLEFRYERQQTSDLLLASSIFYDDLDALGWDNVTSLYRPLGKLKTAGFEVEAQYQTGDTRFTASHSLVKLVGQDITPGVSTLLTSANLGYGYDLANWPDQITKFTVHHQITKAWSADAELDVEWGFPGDQSYLAERDANPPNGPGTPAAAIPGYNQATGPNVFLNWGIQDDIDSHSSVRFDAYDVIGWVNRRYDKREFLDGDFGGDYREAAPSVALTYSYKF